MPGPLFMPFMEPEQAVHNKAHVDISKSAAKSSVEPEEAVQTRVNGDHPESCEERKDWKLERDDALSLLRSLYEAHSEDEVHRRWLLKRWPELPPTESSDTLPDPDRFIPELYIRATDEHNTVVTIYQESCTGKFNSAPGVEDEGGHIDVEEVISRLSDQGVVEAIPFLLPKLQTKALHSTLSTLLGRKKDARNRPWLVKQISKELKTFTWQYENKISKRLLQIFRDPSSFHKDAQSGQLLLDTSSPLSAAESAFEQLDQIPCQCLKVMLEVILDRPPGSILGKLPVGKNKNEVITALTKRVRDLLSDYEEGQALPELVRKSLVVMSLSARYAFGDDSKLIDFLGPVPLETKVLQSSLLTALSDLGKLSNDNAQLVYSLLIEPPRQYKKPNLVNFREPVRKILLDCLLWSEVRVVPDQVKEALVTIRRLGRKWRNKKTNLDAKVNVKRDDDAQIELEVEAILRISSHLVQIIHNWNECISEIRSPKEKISPFDISPGGHNAGVIPVESERVIEIGDIGVDALQVEENMIENDGLEKELQSDPFDETNQKVDLKLNSKGPLVVEVQKPKRKDQETEGYRLSLTDESENQQVARMADEVAAAGYTLIGCAMERTSRLSGVSVKKPVRKYLRSGLKRNMCTEPGNTKEEQHQVAIILSFAEHVPIISHRALDNVKRRLGMG